MKEDRLKLLYQYLAQSNDWCSSEELASYLHVTVRSVRNYIRELSDGTPDLPLILTSAKGYRFNPEVSGNNPYDSEHFHSKELHDTPEERLWYLIRKILHQNLSLDQIIDTLGISERTVMQDFQSIRRILNTYGLKLRHRKDLYFISGEESAIRLASYQCIRNTSRIDVVSSDMIIRLFPEYDCASIFAVVMETCREQSLTLSTSNGHELMIRLMIQINRMNHGNILGAPMEELPHITHYFEYQTAKVLSCRLEAIHLIPYNEWEVEYLAALIISKTDTLLPEKCLLIPNFTLVRSQLISSLRITGPVLGLDLLTDEMLLFMTSYFQRLEVRQITHFYSDDLMFSSLKESYPVIQDVCAWMLLFFSGNNHIPIDSSEIGPLVHIFCSRLKSASETSADSVPCTVICPRFGEFPGLLLKDLEDHLGSTLTIDTVVERVDHRTWDENRLTLSVLPAENLPHLVHISPYLRSADFRHIYSELHAIRMREHAVLLKKELMDFLPDILMERTSSSASYDAVFGHMTDRLLRDGYVAEGFRKRITEREVMDSTVYHGAALPHISEPVVLRSFAYILLPEQTISWAGESVQLVLMIGLTENRIVEMQRPYEHAIRIFSNYKNLLALSKARDSADFLEILDQLETNHVSGH